MEEERFFLLTLSFFEVRDLLLRCSRDLDVPSKEDVDVFLLAVLDLRRFAFAF